MMLHIILYHSLSYLNTNKGGFYGRINIGSPLNTNNTFDLSIIIALIDGADPLEICDMYDFSDFRVLALIFKKHYTEIANLFKSENLVITETSLANLREERTLRMFPTLFVKNDDG